MARVFAHLRLHADFAFLDDTGADIPSVSEPDDLPLLGTGGPGPWWGPTILINTAGGVVYRRTIWIMMQWMSAPGNMLTNPGLPELAIVNPGFSFAPSAVRLSGMSLRAVSFTATAPDGSNNLHIGDKKNGVVSRLPVV